MEVSDKRKRIQNAAIKLFFEKGIEHTSVNEIVQEANVAKGTFYLYFKDKQELISQLLTQKHGCMLNDILLASRNSAEENNLDWRDTFTIALLDFYQTHPKVLKMIQKNITTIFDTIDHRRAVFSHITVLNEFLDLLRHDEESDRDVENRFFLLMEILGNLSFHAIFYEYPDKMEYLHPELLKIAKRICM